MGVGAEPELTDALYKSDVPLPEGQPPAPGAQWSETDPPAHEFGLTEFEPVFDAADFLRFGKDIIGQLSHVTNRAGVAWLPAFLGPEYRVHVF
ncbi:MAG: hypothetical protein AAF318_13410 [Pseudomonadota bacterium]